jgi:hypothetical protein
MFPRQDDPDAHEDAKHKPDDETKPGSVTHRAIAQVENSRRFVFVHRRNSAPLIGARKIGETFVSGEGETRFIRIAETKVMRRGFFRIDDNSKRGHL